MTLEPTLERAIPAHCRKGAGACVCAGVEPFANRHRVLVLQHPQEQDAALGTACVVTATLRQAVLKVGLSWPNLSRALGENVDPKKWGVLYLGPRPDQKLQSVLTLVDRKGEPLPDQKAARAGLEGIVLLDGSWSQAKALWWRNAWLLKLTRVVLTPGQPSRYGTLRKEPRRESLSTVESAALALSELAGDPALAAHMVAPFERMLAGYRQR